MRNCGPDHHSRRVITVLMATMATKKVIPKVAKESMLVMF